MKMDDEMKARLKAMFDICHTALCGSHNKHGWAGSN